MRETVFQAKCIKWVAKNYKGKVWTANIHGSGYSNKGFPDLLMFGQGKVIVVELKSDSGYKLQPDQLIWKNRFSKAGITHYVIKSFDAFCSMVEEEYGHADG